MFAGHIGVALAAGRLEPRLNVGVLAAASLLLDFLLWLFILAGWESVSFPAEFAHTHQPRFEFPYSHGLLPGAAWSALCGIVVAWLPMTGSASRWRTALLVAGVAFSHWILDALVHRPEMPLAGAASRQVGLGLWDHLAVALAIESALVIAGLLLFVPGSGLPRGKRIALSIVVIALLAFTILGMTVAPAPPSAVAMAASSVGTLFGACLLIGWLGAPAHGGK